MTDLPQLHDLLVDAARRRRRRIRARRGITRLTLAAAAAAFAVFAIPRIVHEPPDREVPAATPTPAAPAPTTLEQAYSVFRRAERPSDRPPNFPKDGTSPRLIAMTPTAAVYLYKDANKLCLLTRSLKHRGYGMGCGPKRTYLDGHRPIGSFSDQKGPSTIAFALPDGVKKVTLTLESGHVASYAVKDNGFARDVPERVLRVQWRAPDGTPQDNIFHAAPAFRARDFYSMLSRPEQPGDKLEDALPGARLLAEGDGAKAWLVPRRGAVCLVLDADGLQSSACRRKVADVRTPVIVAGLGRRSVVAVAYPDYLRSVTVVPAGVPTVAGKNGLLILDGAQARGLRYRGKRIAVKPADRAEWPTAIPAEE